jgi:hypothetical protein
MLQGRHDEGLWSQLTALVRFEADGVEPPQGVLAESECIVEKVVGTKDATLDKPSNSKLLEVARPFDVDLGWWASGTSRSPLIRLRGVRVCFARQM